MAFVLVQWIKDKRTSVIPTAWVVSPNPLPATLPAPGLCYWRRKTSRWETNIIASSGEPLQSYAMTSSLLWLCNSTTKLVGLIKLLSNNIVL